MFSQYPLASRKSIMLYMRKSSRDTPFAETRTLKSEHRIFQLFRFPGSAEGSKNPKYLAEKNLGKQS